MSEGNVTYLCCSICGAWYREGQEHLCDPGNFDIRYGERAIPGRSFMRQTFNPPIVSTDEKPTVIHTEIQGDFSDNERLYALLERIAVALENLSAALPLRWKGWISEVRNETDRV